MIVFWVLMPMAVAIYMFGVVMGRRGWQPMSQHESKIKHWHECSECLPGVTQQFGADTKDHLAQVVRWHEEDFHEGEDLCTSSSNGLPTSSGFTSPIGWVREMVGRRIHKLQFSLLSGFARIAFPISRSNLDGRLRRRWTGLNTTTYGPSTPT